MSGAMQMQCPLEVMQGTNLIWPLGLQKLEIAMVKGSVPRKQETFEGCHIVAEGCDLCTFKRFNHEGTLCENMCSPPWTEQLIRSA